MTDCRSSPFVMKAIGYKWEIVAVMDFVRKRRRFEHEVVFHTKHICYEHVLGDSVLLLHLLQKNHHEDNNNNIVNTFSLRCIMIDFRLISIPGLDILSSQGIHLRNIIRT